MARQPHLDVLTPAARFVGRKIVEVDAHSGEVRLAFLARPEFANRHGTVAGGFLAAMLDSTTAAPILAFLSEELTVVTTKLEIFYERPAPIGPLTAAGRVTERGEREVRSEGELLDAGGDIVARGRASFRIVRRGGT